MRALAAATVTAAGAAGAQTRTLTACTPDALTVCAELRLTAGPSSFELALRPLSSAQAGLPLSVYNLVLGTGAAAATPRTTPVTPTVVGGAVVTDASPWEVFDSGDALFLSALTDRGVGGCAAGADVGGFGQAARACGAGQYVAFSFVPTSHFDPAAFTILNLEAVGLAAGLPGASCGAPGAECVVTPGAVVPEPAAALLTATGLAALAAGAARRRRA